MTKLGLWLRWSWRDLRERWLQVTMIALIIALGTAVYVGLGSTTPWRTESAKASYELLNMYDLRGVLTRGSYIEQDWLLDAIRSIEHAGWIATLEVRLVVPTFVSVLDEEHDILVRGELVGVNVSDGGPHVNGIYVNAGRALNRADAGQPVGLLEYHFGEYYDLPAQGQIELSGGMTLDYVGLGMSPEYFMITSEEGGMWAQANFAVVFVPLETAQALTEHSNMINHVVMTLTDEADRDTVRAEIEQALATALPDVSIALREQEENTIYRLVFQSINMNQQVYDIMIILFMAGAAFGAANLAGRIVEAQRRQIGIGMALGMSPRGLAIRPLLIGGQIAVLGTFFGLILGLLVGQVAQEWMESLIPLPVAGELFQTDIFLRATAVGLLLPFVATIYPVWRAVRVQPVDAIRTGHLIDKGNGFAPLLANISTPGRSFSQMPVRNLLRAPRRTILTILGIATAITTLIGLAGILDSANNALNQIKREAYQDYPRRLTIFLNNVYPVESEPIADIARSPALATAKPALRVPGSARRGDTDFRILIEVLDLENNFWTPTLTTDQRRSNSGKPGVLISRSAALDLGIGVGDTFILEHPRRTGLFTYQMLETEVEVMGLHPDPWRVFVYMDDSQAGLFNLAGMTNVLYANPAIDLLEVKARRMLFQFSNVASIVSVQDSVKSTGSMLDEAIRFLSGVQIAVLVLAFLIAFSSTNISISERAREIATMFAFGVPVRTVTRMTMLENCITGLLGTLLGFGLGMLILIWFVTKRMPIILPEMRLPITLSPPTVGLAFLVGVVVVTLTPLLAVHKMAHMDIPSTLRVME